MKFEELARLGDLYTILTKDTGFRFQGTRDCGEMTLAGFMGGKGYVSKVCLHRFILMLTLHLQ